MEEVPKDIKKLKTKAKYEISTIKLFQQRVQTFEENYFTKFNFSQNWPFMFPQVKAQLSVSQKNFLVTV